MFWLSVNTTPFAWAIWPLSLLIGISLALTGSGGSIFTMPIVTYVGGVDPHTAVPVSLAIVGITASISAFYAHRDGDVDLRAVWILGAGGAVGSWLGAQAVRGISAQTLMLFFGLLMWVVSAWMALRSFRRARAVPPAVASPHYVTATAIGVALGGLTGFLGVGGGFLIVPTLVWLLRFPMRRAIGTSLALIALNSLSAFIVHMAMHKQINAELGWRMTTWAAAAAGGVLLGRRWSARFSQTMLQRIFSALVLAVGSWMVFTNIGG